MGHDRQPTRVSSASKGNGSFGRGHNLGKEHRIIKGILFVLDSSGEVVGGIEGKVLLIAEDLHKRGLLAPVLITGDAKSYFARQFMSLGFPVYGFPMRNLSDISSAADRAKPIIRKHNVVLVQSHNFRESIVARRIRRAFPELRHVSRVHMHIEGYATPWWRKTLYHLLDWWTSSDMDICLPISEFLTQELTGQSWIPKEKIRVVLNGIPALGPPDAANNSEMPLTPEAVVIGDLQARKQQCLAVEAVGLLHAQGLDVKLHIIGRDLDNYEAAIRESMRKNKVEHLVHIHGYQAQDEIVRIVRDVPVFLLPSLFEGVPTSIIEGMSMRKLVITTPTGGTAELVEDGVNGFLHAPTDAQALANTMKKVFSTPAKSWETMRDAGFNTWQKRFSLGNMIDDFLEVYRDIGLFDDGFTK